MAKYNSTGEARAAFDRDMASGKATTSDWGSYYHSTADSPSGGKVTNTGNYYTYKPDGSAYYTDNNGNRTQLSGQRGSADYVNGEFHSNGSGGHTSVGYDSSLSGVNSAPRELTTDEKAHYDQLVQDAIQKKYGWSASGTTANNSYSNNYNADLQYALQNSGMDAEQYRQDLLNRVGTLRSDGRYVTQAEIDTELNRLGLNNMSAGNQQSIYKIGDTRDFFGDGKMWIFDGKQFVPMNNAQQGNNQSYRGNSLYQYASDNPGQEYLRQAMAEAEAAQKARLAALMSQIDGQRPGINNQADEAARQAYINQRLGQQAARENLAASGLSNTGISETTNLGLQTAYQQALDEIGKNKQNALLGLDQAKIQAQQTGNADIATIQSQYAQQMATMQSQYEQEMYNRWLNDQQLQMQQAQNEWQQQYAMQQMGMQQSDADWQKQLAMQQYNYQLQQMQQNQSDTEADKYYKLLNAGVLSQDVLQWAGINNAGDYYNMLRQMAVAQSVPKTTRSAGSGNGSSSGDDLFTYTPAATTPLTTATFGGQQYQMAPDGLQTLFRTTTSGDIFGNMIPNDPTAYLRR